jgi:hypothetical protein
MIANELRIGNWVNYCNGKRILDAELFLQLLKYTTPFDPIPLTEEWLLKFGFVSNPYEDRYEKGTIHIECDKTKGATYLWVENMPHIKYAHQLQNLYFALTGEELTKGGELNNIAFSNKTSTHTANVDLNKPLTKITGL